MTDAMWSTRDEVVYWLQFVGAYAALGLIVVVRFVVYLAFRVIDIALFLAGVVAVVAFAAWAAERLTP